MGSLTQTFRVTPIYQISMTSLATPTHWEFSMSLLKNNVWVSLLSAWIFGINGLQKRYFFTLNQPDWFKPVQSRSSNFNRFELVGTACSLIQSCCLQVRYRARIKMYCTKNKNYKVKNWPQTRRLICVTWLTITWYHVIYRWNPTHWCSRRNRFQI